MSKPKIDEKFQRKVKLFCVLHSNNFQDIKQAADKEGNCERCRANNEGICRVRYYKYDFLMDEYRRILKMKAPEEGKFSFGYDYNNLDKWGEFLYVMVDGVKYRYSKVEHQGICFGFLKNDLI